MKLGKKEFCRYMNAYKKLSDFDAETCRYFGSFGFYTVPADNDDPLLNPLDLIRELIMELSDRDPHDCSPENTIDYFFFELDYGSRWKRGKYTLNGEDIPLDTVEHLYDALIKEEELWDEN